MNQTGKMIKIIIDGQACEVNEGDNLLKACLQLGLNLPYFCWHPAMHSVGACRQCAVKQFKNETDTRGSIVMACMTPVSDGMRISINDPEAKEFRSSVTEWLMMNHPHDCPVCDEGGECHLQDMVVMTGHVYRKYRFKKRTHRNQDLGPFLNHEMNRCIQCYRCVRFYRDYAGGRDFNVFGIHQRLYFGRVKDGPLESEFSGNLVEVCPTGVFTDKTLRKHYVRKWDLRTGPSICPHCSVGCNISPAARNGTLRRIQNRYNCAVNGYFICDRGRYGYEFVNGPERLRYVKKSAAEQVIKCLANAKTRVGIGSPRASLEANFALLKMVGSENFYAGIAPGAWGIVKKIAEVLKEGSIRIPSIAEIEMADAVLVLGEDVTNTAPRVALAIRQAARTSACSKADQMHIPYWNDAMVREAAQNDRIPVFIASYAATKLDDLASGTFRGSPPAMEDWGREVQKGLTTENPQDAVKDIVAALKQSKNPLIVAGSGAGSASLVDTAIAIAKTLGGKASLCFVVPECNTIGLALLTTQGLDELTSRGELDALVVLENDLSERLGGEAFLELRRRTKSWIAIDSVSSKTTDLADAVFPAATFAETRGTFINHEGRAQAFYQVMPLEEDQQTKASWRWISELGGGALTYGDLLAGLTSHNAVFECLRDVAGVAPGGVDGMKVPRESHRASGRTALTANIDINEPLPPQDNDSPLSFTMEGYEDDFPDRVPGSLRSRYWRPGWNSLQSLNKFQEEVSGHLRCRGDGCVIHRVGPEARGETPAQLERGLPFKSISKDEHWIVPLYRIFGSDRLSSLAPALAERVPAVSVVMNSREANKLDLRVGETVRIGSLSAIIAVDDSLAEQVAGIVVTDSRATAMFADGIFSGKVVR